MIKNIIDHPLYILLFGSGGIIIVIVSIIPLFKKLHKSFNPQDHLKNIPPSHETPVYEKPTPPSFNARNKSTEDAIDFVSELKYKSPAEDVIKISKISMNDK